MTRISVVIGIYGDRSVWWPLAYRAMASVDRQTYQPVDAQIIYADTLAEARNKGAKQADGDWLVFLDADDELDPGYLQAMYEAKRLMSRGRMLYQPATQGVHEDGTEEEPVLIPQRPLHTGNFMVIGTMLERDLFLEVGGFDEEPIYEDWALFIRCHQAGAGFVRVPDAVYRVHVNAESGRNKPGRSEEVRWFRKIRTKYYTPDGSQRG